MPISNAKKRWRRAKMFLPLAVMSLPGAIYLLVNNYIPMGGIIISFQNYNYSKGIFGSSLIGFKNFEFLFRSPELFNIIRNTLLYNIAFIVLGTVVAVFLAILMSEIVSRGFTRVFQASLLMPYLISMVLVGYVVYAMLQPQYGLMNRSILPLFGIAPVNWYFTTGPWVYILPIVYIWKNAGFSSIIYYATIVGIDTQLYEAAKIDGASKIKQIRYITLPMLVPVVAILTILATGRIFNSDFGLFYQVPMNSSTLYPTTNVIETYVFNALFKLNDIGMSSSVGLLQSVVGCVLLLTTNAIVRKASPDNSMF